MLYQKLCKANVMAMEAILEVQVEAIFIQRETSEIYYACHSECLNGF